jgi:hypothetical protein
MTASPKIEWQPGRLLIAGQPLTVTDEFREAGWQGARLEPAASVQHTGSCLRLIHSHLSDAAEATFMLPGAEDLPPRLREGILALTHAYSVFAAALAVLAVGDPPASVRRAMASELAGLLNGVAIAETAFVETLQHARGLWLARFVDEAPQCAGSSARQGRT